VGANAFRETPTMIDDQSCGLLAQMLMAAEAGATFKAARGEPADSNPIAHTEAFGTCAQGRDTADDFVPRHERESRLTPLVVNHREIGMTNPAMFYRDLDPLIRQRAKVNLEWLEWHAGCFRSVTSDHHRLSPGWIVGEAKSRRFPDAVRVNRASTTWASGSTATSPDSEAHGP
jgi:hypothetical protein